MDAQDIYEIVCQIYQELYRQATIRPKYTYDPKHADHELIQKFVQWLQKHYKPGQIGEDLLVQYFEFQFSRYSGVVTKYGKNSVMMNWLIGQKAIATWLKRDLSKKFLVRYRCNKDFKLNLRKHFAPAKQVKVNQQKRNFLSQINKTEEFEKKRYYNKHVGYLYCGDITTLYHPASEVCNGCNFKDDCTKRLQKSLPNVYKIRFNNHVGTTEGTTAQ